MRAAKTLLSLTLSAAVLTACASNQADTGDMNPPSVDGDGPSWSATITPLVDDGHGGTAAAWLDGDQTVVQVTLDRGSPGGHHPWHVHRGTCGSGGGVVGSGSAYPQLHPGPDADVTETAELAVALDPDESYYINIHQSTDAMGTIVGCGELVFTP